MRNLCIFVTVGLCLACALPVLADWDDSMPAKWVQNPDLSPMGIDINASPVPGDFVLADDFLCMERGFVTGIHIYGSWLEDFLPFMDDPLAVKFTLSIHADIPASQNPEGYSMPGELLWIREFHPGEFIARPWAENIDEGWLDPPIDYFFPGDHVCWQYNFNIPEQEAFEQLGSEQEPMVYWLDLKATPLDEQARFGWKTSMDHWNDNAVYGQGLEPYLGPWYELFYPPQHELAEQPIDLAFVIQCTSEEPEPTHDLGDAMGTMYPTLLANNGANHLIVPGMALGTLIDGEWDGQPNADATGDDTDGTDDEDGVFISSLHPGKPATINILATMPGWVEMWLDFNVDGDWMDANEHVLNSVPVNPGSNTFNFLVPNSATPYSTTGMRVRYSSQPGLNFYGPAPDGEVEDYMVEILDRLTMKWLQEPDLSPMGIDVNCSQRPEDFILADDFLCTDEGPLTDFHIFGSWLNDYLPFGDDPRGVKFTLSIHADIPASENPDGYSMPGEVLWIHEFGPGDFTAERFAGEIVEGWMNPPSFYIFPADWTCWVYKFHLNAYSAFLQHGTQDNPIVYWLDVKAEVFDEEAVFGWKTSVDHWNDKAVWGVGFEPYPGPWWELFYPANHEMAGRPIDLAFRIFADSVAPDLEGSLPKQPQLLQNVPNPFNPSTDISYVLPEGGGTVQLKIFDIKGRKVRTLVDGNQVAGPQKATWNGCDDAGQVLPSGIYFYRLIAPNCDETLRMVLVR